ncbi:MAG: energy-coupling factor transporter ATPase [candidate division Zixibacteria bacterium]|nr:energy-coupling factor transporter ATPase [candidate division Zixibacteria bacterium]
MIQLKNIFFDYALSGGKVIHALSDINLDFREGELVSIIGSNGSGKTTLARLLNGLLISSSGKVLVDGLNPKYEKDLKLIRQRVGMVFQNPDNQIITTSVEREIAFGLENLNLPYEEMRERVEWALSAFNLWDYKNTPPHKLSGGEKQKVAVAAVLAMKPKYLILDEPTSLLSPEDRDKLNSLIERLAQEIKVTIFNITQFPDEAVLAHRILVLSDGKVVLDGPPSKVFGESQKFKEIGLSLPKNLEITDRLKNEGFKFKRNILDFDDLIKEFNSLEGVNLQLPLGHDKSKKSKYRKTVSKDKTLIKLENSGFVYNPGTLHFKEALKGINLEIEEGEFAGLLGPTGSGKSTLVQHFNGLLFATSGNILVNGLELKEKKPYLQRIRKEIGLVFQFPENQFFEDTVYNDIAFGPKNLGLENDEINRRVKKSMDTVGLDFDDFAWRLPFSLSHGEQRRAAIAGVLALEPQVLILDEPTAGLDSDGTCRIKNALLELNKKGVTIILISHNLELVAEVCERIIFLKEGRVLYDGTKIKFFKEAAKHWVEGIKLPVIIELVNALNASGFNIREDIYNLDELVKELVSMFMR